MQNNEVYEIDLLHIIGKLIDKIWLIVLAGLVGGVAMFYYATYYISPRYQSYALFYVNNSSISIGDTSVSVSTSQISASRSIVDTYVVILKSRNTLETVIEKGGYELSYNQIASMISGSAVSGTEVLRVTVTDSNPVRATSIANTIAEVLPDKISEIVTGTSSKVVDYSVINLGKVAPSITKYATLGFGVGAALACLLIFIIDLLDDTIKDDDYLLSTYSEIPMLAAIPNLKKNSGYYYYYNNKAYYKKKGYDIPNEKK